MRDLKRFCNRAKDILVDNNITTEISTSVKDEISDLIKNSIINKLGIQIIVTDSISVREFLI